MRLCGEDYIKMISGSAVFDDDSAIYNQQVRDIESSFRILFPKKDDVFEQLSILTMSDDNVRGHCFFRVCLKIYLCNRLTISDIIAI